MNDNDFREYLDNAADGHCIYVLGAQGQVLSDMTEKDRKCFISRLENGNVLRINEDIAAYNLKAAQGYDMIQAYDCSGLIVHFLEDLHHEIGYDTTAQGLYNLCDFHPSLNELQPYDLVFIRNSDGYISHCGVYIGDGKVIESRRIGYGVQCTNFEDRPWNCCGHMEKLMKYVPEDKHPELIITKPLMKGDHIRQLQQLLNDYGFACGSVDGKFGVKTAAALQDFCRYYGA